MRALPAPRGHRSGIDVRSFVALSGRSADRAARSGSSRKADMPNQRVECPLMTQSRRRHLVASHHIVGASTARMTIGIQMNHWHPLGIRHVGTEGQRDLALVGQLSSALVFGDHEEVETTKENPSLRPHRR